ncbi:MAG: hypothetical protein MJE77_35305 [Proteobacteria bacterium]|nr:hypothetical protein [Pseudomonadota bacterium]
MERRHPQRRFRRPGRKGKHIEFLGRCVDRDSARIWLMREGDAYWLMSEFGFLHGIDRYWERDEIEPGDPGGWG